MDTTTRLGTKLPAGEDVLGRVQADKQTDDLIGDLAVKHGLTRERARMLVDRFGAGREGLDGAAQNLQSWKT